ncbi:putative amidophosphoribosyltransferase [Microbacterium natoriense]|uniref:Amidophosphoribosyltransferase n=1 Tax=Microbacterium natoriense TaxID=284570 RepID=A0AAW8EW97_9MICO|nr:phosphoribosyltransferase family protein [Microbacterium natoriense]MDQ0647803.1 putative amidophosphoribosyltransferase [Microbacterium natoriense]
MPTSTRWQALLSELGAFVLAATCAGCDEPGALLCDACRSEVRPEAIDLRTPRGLPVRAALRFDGVVARCIRRLKGEGDTMLARPLGAALGAVLLPELGDGIHSVPVPTSSAAFRRRGYRVPDLLISRAGAEPWSLLRHRGRHADQRGLTVRERARNVQESMYTRREGRGAKVVLVDDVVTTGATFDEAARALTAAGFDVVCAVALAATERHRERTANPPTTRRK